MKSTILNDNPRTHIVGVQAYQNTLGARATIGLAYLLMFWACILPFFAIDTIARAIIFVVVAISAYQRLAPDRISQ